MRRVPPPPLRNKVPREERPLLKVNVLEKVVGGACCLSRCGNRAKWRVTFAATGGSALYCYDHGWPFKARPAVA